VVVVEFIMVELQELVVLVVEVLVVYISKLVVQLEQLILVVEVEVLLTEPSPNTGGAGGKGVVILSMPLANYSGTLQQVLQQKQMMEQLKF
jgi:hypothetical protein